MPRFRDYISLGRGTQGLPEGMTVEQREDLCQEMKAIASKYQIEFLTTVMLAHKDGDATDRHGRVITTHAPTPLERALAEARHQDRLWRTGPGIEPSFDPEEYQRRVRLPWPTTPVRDSPWPIT